MKKKLVIALIALTLSVGGGVAAFWPYFHHRHVLRLPGIVEVQEVRLGSKVGGRVEAPSDSRRGRHRLSGSAAARLRAPDRRTNGTRPGAAQQAEADWLKAVNGAAMRTSMRPGRPWSRPRRAGIARRTGFAKKKSIRQKATGTTPMPIPSKPTTTLPAPRNSSRKRRRPAQDFDAAVAARDCTRGRRDSLRFKFTMMKIGSRIEDKAEAKAEFLKAKAQFEQLKNGTRSEDIASAKAKVDELRANVEAIDINLKETTVSVPPNLGKAVVEVIAVRPGDLVPANQPTIRVLRVEDLWVKIFVPETQYGLVTLGKEVDVTIDSYPGRIFKGTIIQCANISEFTPRNVQSVDERRHQVFAVKVHVPDCAGSPQRGHGGGGDDPAGLTFPRR